MCAVRARADLSPEARARPAHIRVYPSRRCSYTIAKARIFVRVRNEGDRVYLPDCVIRHVLLHELAHTVSPAHGHGPDFRATVRWLSRGGAVPSCGPRVPPGYNPCH